MALLALILPGCGGELRLMFVVMAVKATAEPHFVQRVFTLRDVALRAFEFGMFTLQRILRRSVSLQVELRGLPAGDLVAGFARAPIGTFCELAVVLVFVAVHALGELQLLFEIAVHVTGRAINRLVFALQRIFRLGVVKVLFQTLGDLLPTQGRMAGRTCLLDSAMMRILVAVIALAKRKSLVSRLVVRPGCMALLALHLLVLSGQRVPRFRMIERRRDVLPVIEVVAGFALRPETSLVKIFVARGASLGNADE